MSDSHDASTVTASTNHGRLTLTLNRPDERNVLSSDVVAGLRAGIAAAAADDGIRVVVITNVGSVFCAGADLKAPPKAPDDSPQVEEPPFVTLLSEIRNSPKPVLARVDGHVTAGGVGLVAVCDLSVMRQDCLIGFTEVRVGVVPAIISVVCLPKMRPADASELMLGGERVPASRAAEVGLINYAEPAEHLDERVDDLCNSLAKGGPQALAATKTVLRTVPAMSESDAFGAMSHMSMNIFGSSEAAEGIAAFRQRRPPSWAPAD